MWLTAFGIAFLLVRLYINEFRVAKWIQPENHFISRINTYLFSFAFIFSLEISILNIPIISGILPFTIIFLRNDMNFILNIKRFVAEKNITDPKDIFWILIERISLHLPILIAGYYMVFTDIFRFVSMEYGIWTFIIPYFFCIFIYMLVDVRWADDKNPAVGRLIILVFTSMMVLLYCHVNFWLVK
jgi:hypothetical protein